MFLDNIQYNNFESGGFNQDKNCQIFHELD